MFNKTLSRKLGFLLDTFQAAVLSPFQSNLKTIKKVKANIELECLSVIYYPYLFSKWEVIYESLLLKKQKRFKHTLAYNPFTKCVSFSDIYPVSQICSIDSKNAISYQEVQTIKNEQHLKAREFIKNYYIHYKKIWRIPQINCTKLDIIHFPYTIHRKKSDIDNPNSFLIYEHTSHQLGSLKDEQVVFEYFTSKKEVIW
jgi:hypothetical protein